MRCLTNQEANRKYRNVVGYVFELSTSKGKSTPYAVESEINFRKWQSALAECGA